MRYTFSTTLLALAGLSIVAVAQQPAPPRPDAQSPAVTFRVEVNYVEIDAIVTDAQGNFARNLTKEDFQVTEDGHPQTLSIFTPVDIPIEHADPPLFAKNAIVPDVATNRTPFEGRIFVLVLDDVNTRFQRTARTRIAARQFVERYIGVNDLVAVVSTGGRTKAMQDFTSNRQLVLAAIDHMMGNATDSSTSAALKDYFNNRDVPGGGWGLDHERRHERARTELPGKKHAVDAQERIGVSRRHAGTPKGGGLSSAKGSTTTRAIPSRTAMPPTSSKNRRTSSRRPPDRMSASTVWIRAALTSGMEDGIEIASFADDNSISPTNLQDELRISQDSLRYLSEQTGGFAVVNRNDYRDA